MQFTTKFALLALLVASATFVAAADNDTAPATNGTEPATNGTVLDDGSMGNSTAPATNGTVLDNGNSANSTAPATNGTTPTNATAPATPQASGGSTRRSLQKCEYGCPRGDKPSGSNSDTFTCKDEHGSCTYQRDTGVISSGGNGGACPSVAEARTAGCTAGDRNNGGVVRRRAHKHRRSSREMQYEAIARRFLL
ncbi:hypothetical protein AURDEDRAFT_130670 [Auricularia subglabra TFB-10046 SS5]|uniref:Uncharacterized protein n=1 Tax=Auricularia subglabra (strain TFB-10046 / SS5) TaxID=717982 RepID=J0CXA0_AURST|nr:hypothetical protein AURDEDRAFT_130670 [Auricularia subglabra TFB-10046 SS5]